MQFRDLKKQYSVLKQDIDAAMMEVAAASAFIMGRPVKELEAGLAEYVGVKHCISCGNGTDAQRSSRWKGPHPFLWMWMAIRSIWTPRIWNGR